MFELVRFLAYASTGMRDETELLIVDDNSKDGSEETVKQLQSEVRLRVHACAWKAATRIQKAQQHMRRGYLERRTACMPCRAMQHHITRRACACSMTARHACHVLHSMPRKRAGK